MVDAHFADDRLAPLYDTFEGARDDLPAYLRIIRELKAATVLDVGCGTGNLALLAAAMGVKVTGVDPARASLNMARQKPWAHEVRWCEGVITDAPDEPFDAVTMTGNVAQVFLEDSEWTAALGEVRQRLGATGHLVFETRRPDARAWQTWSDPFEETRAFDGLGMVRRRRSLLEVELPTVTFRERYTFPDGETIDSTSTLRFRTDEENRDLLSAAGFSVTDVRQAPDRPGLEFVYLAAPQA